MCRPDIVVACQSERSQHKNRASAMKQLKARLYEAELQKREAEADAANAAKTDIGWGHQIRSYVLQPYQLVKDLRTGSPRPAPPTFSTATSTASWRRRCRSASPGRRSRSRMSIRAAVGGALLAALLVGCRAEPQEESFPKPGRPVASIVGDSFSTEDARDRMGEFERVVELAGVQPGMWVADLGAGEGYYAVRLSPVVGRQGRVLAEDIVPEVRDRLAERVQRENLENVAVSLGEPDDPELPPRSFDRIFMVHMYHEVNRPTPSCGIRARR
jgi:hypothetical protein